MSSLISAAQSRVSAHDLHLAWMAPVLSGGGYSSEAIAFAAGLAPLRPRNFTLHQFAEQVDDGFASGLTKKQRKLIGRLLQTGQDFALSRTYEKHAGESVVVCHSTPDLWRPAKFAGWDEVQPCPPPWATFSVGRTMFETDAMPADWVARCNRMDQVWVPTHFHLSSFAAAGVDERRLRVVGEAVDGRFFRPTVAREGGDGAALDRQRPFRFLSVFKWEARKGWDVLLRAYFEEFSPSEGVELVLKTRPFYSDDDFAAQIDAWAAKSGLPATRPAVRISDVEMPLRALPSLYREADAFVLPSRGEGWGRPHVEAMATGLPVIATNWSGPAAFLDEEVGYPLGYELEPVPAEMALPGHSWAAPSVGHLRERMRDVVTRPDEARRRGAAARERMLARFSPEALAEEVEARLAEIAREIAARKAQTKEEL